ncbi:hypothetical protein P781_03235 [Vibrio mimicus CAIM 1883]|nr:hypothetical protein P781_03235 [Vibrio mimicus CAIM 1883]ERM62705.1 hypothetical protein P780_03210 [Vibrio mimicus CAIM 1882]
MLSQPNKADQRFGSNLRGILADLGAWSNFTAINE